MHACSFRMKIFPPASVVFQLFPWLPCTSYLSKCLQIELTLGLWNAARYNMSSMWLYSPFGAFEHRAFNGTPIFGMRPNIRNKHAYMYKSLIYSVMWLYKGTDRDFLEYLKLSQDIFPELGTFPALGSCCGKPFYLGRPCWEGGWVCLKSRVGMH